MSICKQQALYFVNKESSKLLLKQNKQKTATYCALLLSWLTLCRWAIKVWCIFCQSQT